MTPECAVIFDVDGPLLELTPPEEDAFFAPFRALHGLQEFSRDWDGYRVRNDLHIFEEILERHLGRKPFADELDAADRYYHDVLEQGFATGELAATVIPGARDLLQRLCAHEGLVMGTATANFERAAQIRLEAAGLWPFVNAYPSGADGGGAKSDILARVVARTGLPPERVVFLGDNLNDLEAGEKNGVHFIGFHVNEERQARLKAAGARMVCGDHGTSYRIICEALGLETDRCGHGASDAIAG